MPTGISNSCRRAALLFPRFGSDRVLTRSGVRSLARSDLGVHLKHWPSNPFVKGRGTCKTATDTTRLSLSNEAKPVDNLYFAGEHTSSFYEFQGFMEGAALSGIRAAREILRDIKVGALQ